MVGDASTMFWGDNETHTSVVYPLLTVLPYQQPGYTIVRDTSTNIGQRPVYVCWDEDRATT